ncbi:SIR2 family protein [Tetragenococcus halophilus]|uniref:SIR2 family protein n=1 Tax=Tetragenococcus halophilus TaxID=51669 RepID=UPI0015B8B135|nr:SIR2 family protein [Tetragenococcus halophilus]NWN99618.1 SIR2 family protein [Tetragenococcus halophilus]
MALNKKGLTDYFVSSKVVLSKDCNDNFYENGTKLNSMDTEEKFTRKEFIDRIKSEVSQFVNRSFDNIVVLAGAGASVVTNEEGIDKDYGKTVGMIAENIAKELGDLNREEITSENNEDFENFLTIQQLSNMCNYQIPVKKEEKFNEEFNLEDFLSKVLTYEQYLDDDDKEKDKYLKTVEKILEIIKKQTSYNFDTKKMNHGALLKILSSKLEKENKLTVVTTNYDTLFEEAAESLEMTVIDGFSFSYHPYFDSNMFDWKLVRDVSNVKTTQLEYKENVINLLKIHGSLTWERSESEQKIRRKQKDSVNNPIMVFPSSNKYVQSYEEPYFELFTKFQEFLRRPNTLLITAGFSFADNHIATMITQAIKHNPGLNVLVSDRNISHGHNNWKELYELMKNHFQVTFLKATLNDDLIDYVGEQNVY